MKKCYKLFLSFILISIFYLASSGKVSASNFDKSIYGDGTDASWSLLSMSLPSPYNKTPYITIFYQGIFIKVNFNVEMYMDKGLLVYGDHFTPLQIGYTNDFKAVNSGYFFSGQGVNRVRGEFRYLGLNINGMVQTNSSFPSDSASFTINDLRLMKYSNLPDNIKNNFGIPAEGNKIFEPVKSLINDQNSPAWNFTNQSNFSTIRGMFNNSGLTDDIFDYGIVNSWGAGGGSIRLFFYHPDNTLIIRYATYVGAVNPLWQKIFPGMECSLSFDKNGSIPIYTIEAWEQETQAKAYANMTFKDRNNTLSGTEHDLTWHRHDNPIYKMYINNNEINNIYFEELNDKVLVKPNLEFMTLTYKRSELKTGVNYIKIKCEGRIMIGSLAFNTYCERTICINVKPPRIPTRPAAVITCDRNAIIGQSINFSADKSYATEPGAYIKDYEWTIDGIKYKGINLNKTFNSNGPKFIQLKVTDSNNLFDVQLRCITVLNKNYIINDLNIVNIDGQWSNFFNNDSTISTRDMPVYSGINDSKIPIGSKVGLSFSLNSDVNENEKIVIDTYINDFSREKISETILTKASDFYNNKWHFSININRQQLPADIDNEFLVCLKIYLLSQDGQKRECFFANSSDWGIGNGLSYGRNKPSGNNLIGQVFWYDCSIYENNDETNDNDEVINDENDESEDNGVGEIIEDNDNSDFVVKIVRKW